MAQLTSLSAFGISGGVHAFTAKTEAPTGGPHNPGHITELGVGAWPSQRHAFIAKTAEPIGGPHNPGRITALNVFGVSGRTYSFIGKAPDISVIAKNRRQFYTIKSNSKGSWREYYTVVE